MFRRKAHFFAHARLFLVAESIALLTKLKRLNADQNQLAVLPNFSVCTHYMTPSDAASSHVLTSHSRQATYQLRLETLSLSHNKFTEVPDVKSLPLVALQLRYCTTTSLRTCMPRVQNH